MMDRETLAIAEMKVELSYQQQGKCAACGEPVAVQEAELAHRIPQRKYLLKMYGPEVIHHRMNVCLTHHGACNDKVSIGNRPVDMDALAAAIRKERAK
jgi:hypothetical protein